MPYLAPGRGAARLLRADGRGRRGAPAQPFYRPGLAAPGPRRRAAARGDRHRANAPGARHLPRGPAEQCGRAIALHALRLPQDRGAPRLLSGALGARRRAGAYASAAMSRREEVLAEMGLSPIWKLRTQIKETPLTGWFELKQAVPACTACGLHKSRTQTVFGVGDERADWLLVGEAPGAEEDRLGDPFVGQAGKLLDNMLAAIGLARDDNVYICNVLKCRPPG